MVLQTRAKLSDAGQGLLRALSKDQEFSSTNQSPHLGLFEGFGAYRHADEVSPRNDLGCGNDVRSCGNFAFPTGKEKPRRPESAGLSNMEAEVGIEPA